LWSGADHPGAGFLFKPDASSYDYDAPISEAGWVTPKFNDTRALFAKYLQPGETLPEPPAAYPVTAIAPFALTESAALFDNLPAPIAADGLHNLESYNLGRGCLLYRTTLAAGPAATLTVGQAHDFAWVYLDGKPIGVWDRRYALKPVALPARSANAQLDILVEAMGHTNYGKEISDRKGLADFKITGEGAIQPTQWQVYPFGLDAPQLAALSWKKGTVSGPAFWHGTFQLEKPADTFLDLRSWGKGVVWVNGHSLARFWNIGPTQTAYLPGVWLKSGTNEVTILDLTGPAAPTLAGLEKPILNELHPELDFSHKPN
jgi:beta-galactosidase